MNIPKNLIADSKLLIQAYSEIAEKAGLCEVFSGLLSLGADNAIESRIRSELGDGERCDRLTELLMAGVQTVRLINSSAAGKQSDAAAADKLGACLDILSSAARTSLRDDTSELLFDAGLQALTPGDSSEVNVLKALSDATKACAVMVSIAPAELQKHSHISASADRQAFQELQEKFSRMRSEIGDAVGYDNISGKGIRDGYKTVCSSVLLGIDAHRLLKSKEKLPQVGKALEGLSPREQLDRVDARIRKDNSARLGFEKLAASYNKLCMLDTYREAAFKMARSSTKGAQSFSGDGVDPLLIQLKGIAKHLDDRKRVFHTDSAEFTAMKDALTDIIQKKGLEAPGSSSGSSPLISKAQIVDTKLRTLNRAAADYINAKETAPPRFPNNMTVSRLDYARELMDISSIYLGLSGISPDTEAAAEEFLKIDEKALDFGRLEAYDPECRLEKAIISANEAFDKTVSAVFSESTSRESAAPGSVSQKESQNKAPAGGIIR